MLRYCALVPLLVLTLPGCGGPDVDPEAEDSVDRLQAQERTAAQPLVDLEEASRDGDSERLCRRVYVYKDDLRDCEAAFEEILERERVMSLEVDDVVVRGKTAVAEATVTTVGHGRRRMSQYTFRLVNRGGDWKVSLEG